MTAKTPTKSAKSAKSRLTIKQQDFCLAYVENRGNATQAYLKAYPDSKKWDPQTVGNQASRQLANPEIAAQIEHLRSEAEHRAAISTDRVLREEQCLSFLDPAELIDDDGYLIPPNKLPIATRRAISSFKATEIWSMQTPCPHCGEYAHVGPRGGKRSVRLYKYEYKFWDKGKSLERISKHLGLYEKDNQQKALALLQIILAVLPPAIAEALQIKAEAKIAKMSERPTIEIEHMESREVDPD